MRRKMLMRFMGILVLTVAALGGCGKEEKAGVNGHPEASQMKAICELSTMECYYHNVAKYYEEDASGALFWKKDKKFWIEYSGVVTIGIDADKLRVSVEDDTVKITMPKAKVIDAKVDPDSLTKDSFYVDTDSADVEAEDQTKAFDAAQNNMEESAKKDETLLNSAQDRAQVLLEDYVNNIGKAVGVDYNIEWQYEENADSEKGESIGEAMEKEEAAETEGDSGEGEEK